MLTTAIKASHAPADGVGIETPPPRLARAAHEFEAQMLKELLKPMTKESSLASEVGQDGSDAGANSALSEFASEALGCALSLGGGFGIANRVVLYLSQSGTQPQCEKGTAP